VKYDTWPESAERTRAWYSPVVAARRVDEPEVQDLIRSIAKLVGGASAISRK